MKPKTLMLLIIFGFILTYPPYLNTKSINAQTYNKTIIFPDVNLVDNKTQNNALDQEFILVTDNQGNNGQIFLKILNQDFGLNPPFVKLVEGQKYKITPLNEEQIRYAHITIKLAQVLSISSNVKIQDADPENPDELTLGDQKVIANFIGQNGGVFVIPTTLPLGNYILYVFIQYPYGITGVFSNLATIVKK